jgi:hypothetical protein
MASVVQVAMRAEITRLKDMRATHARTLQITRRASKKGKAKVSKVTQGKQGNTNKTLTNKTKTLTHCKQIRSQTNRKQNKNKTTKEVSADQSQLGQSPQRSIHKHKCNVVESIA